MVYRPVVITTCNDNVIIKILSGKGSEHYDYVNNRIEMQNSVEEVISACNMY